MALVWVCYGCRLSICRIINRYFNTIWKVPVNSPHKGQWRGALMFSLFCVWINGWVNNREAGDLRRHHGHYDVNVMISSALYPVSLDWRPNNSNLPPPAPGHPLSTWYVWRILCTTPLRLRSVGCIRFRWHFLHTRGKYSEHWNQRIITVTS